MQSFNVMKIQLYTWLLTNDSVQLYNMFAKNTILKFIYSYDCVHLSIFCCITYHRRSAKQQNQVLKVGIHKVPEGQIFQVID